MKYVSFLLLLFICLFSSCSSYSYYYSIMSSNDAYAFKNKQGEFVIEGDSIDVIYNFAGENAPITVGVYNRMSKPIYVDWRKSGVVIDGHSDTYKQPLAENVAANTKWAKTYDRYLNDPEGLTMIKPSARVNTQVLELSNFGFHKIPKNEFTDNHSDQDQRGDIWKYKSIVYTNDDSPIYIQTFLAIYEKANNLTDPLIFEADFYMSELLSGGSNGPSSISAFREGRGDFFFVKRKKNSKWKKVGEDSLKALSGVANVTGNIVVWALGGYNSSAY